MRSFAAMSDISSFTYNSVSLTAPDWSESLEDDIDAKSDVFLADTIILPLVNNFSSYNTVMTTRSMAVSFNWKIFDLNKQLKYVPNIHGEYPPVKFNTIKQVLLLPRDIVLLCLLFYRVSIQNRKNIYRSLLLQIGVNVFHVIDKHNERRIIWNKEVIKTNDRITPITNRDGLFPDIPLHSVNQIRKLPLSQVELCLSFYGIEHNLLDICGKHDLLIRLMGVKLHSLIEES